ncbi:hypothetical protein RJ639_028959 [Escallonia herrerae]|uniref:Uncharacterized protein n=1 Tax=Escallonia herrerae TaxID=1293975 RepID=A0AA89BGV3_9ASTE|nr:hypothetical protein RJ639_028959 [Escallonia herrerae]
MYGENQHAKNFYDHMLEALKDPMNLILLVCAVLSIIFRISKHGTERGWFQGATRLAATLVVITVSAGSNFWPGKICHNLSEFSSKIQQVDVLRSGQWQRVPIPDIVVGDVVFLIPGDQVPADGLCLDNTAIQVDKFKTDGQTERTVVDGSDNPFFVSGTNVVHGYARMLVTAVGKNFKSQTINLDGEVIYQFENLTSIIVFNMFNTRSLEKSFFKEIQKEKLFWGITSTIVAFQALMVEALESYADTARLDMGQWSISIAIAALSWPIGRLVKCIPFSNIKWQILKAKFD